MTDPAAILAFLLSGRARFTLESKRTGKRYTYEIRRTRIRDSDDPASAARRPYFVDLLVGPDEWRKLAWFLPGDSTLRAPRNSVGIARTPAWRALQWYLHHLGDDRANFWHSGRCGRCGRELTDPASIETGLGPICRQRAGQGA